MQRKLGSVKGSDQGHRKGDAGHSCSRITLFSCSQCLQSAGNTVTPLLGAFSPWSCFGGEHMAAYEGAHTIPNGLGLGIYLQSECSS